MKWKTYKEPVYKVGDEKLIVSFAWKPVKCSDGHTRWLQRVFRRYRLVQSDNWYFVSCPCWDLVETYGYEQL